MPNKQITVKEETWKRLIDLKYKTKAKNLDVVISEILNRDNQEVKQ